MIRVSRQSDRSLGRVAPLLAALVALAGAFALSACDSSGATASGASSPGAKTVAIIAVLPQDAATEPPWNGRFVQVTVRSPSPQKLAASDWSVFVDGKEQRLVGPPNILPYAPDAATVAFVFATPFTDFVAYRFRVVYAPDSGRKVERSWLYKWAP
jgi:hypothetical protein